MTQSYPSQDRWSGPQIAGGTMQEGRSPPFKPREQMGLRLCRKQPGNLRGRTSHLTFKPLTAAVGN